MICKGLFSGVLLTAVLDDNVENNIQEILKLIEYSKKQKTKYYHAYINENDIKFREWLDEIDPRLRDMKRELSIAIERSEELYESNLESFIEEKSTFIIGDLIKNIFDYLTFKQDRLMHISAKSEFVEELQECYYYIYFDADVLASINTLENTFREIQKEIVHHLAQLDRFCDSHPDRLDVGFNNERFAKEFKSFSKINCSSQSSRRSVKKLKKYYINENSGARECLTCELHTKFSLKNKDGTKQDRIYFHKGKKDILQDKLIVIHIGRHL